MRSRLAAIATGRHMMAADMRAHIRAAALVVIFTVFGALGFVAFRSAPVLPSTPEYSVITPQVTLASFTPRRILAYDWALAQRGCWYVWGGTGPCWAGYDCSGLVYAAYRAAGVPYFGRDTYEMLASGRLHRAWNPVPGELAFFGSGHVELYAGGDWTFGALGYGTAVGYHQWNQWWHPTAFYYVWGS